MNHPNSGNPNPPNHPILVTNYTRMVSGGMNTLQTIRFQLIFNGQSVLLGGPSPWCEHRGKSFLHGESKLRNAIATEMYSLGKFSQQGEGRVEFHTGILLEVCVLACMLTWAYQFCCCENQANTKPLCMAGSQPEIGLTSFPAYLPRV